MRRTGTFMGRIVKQVSANEYSAMLDTLDRGLAGRLIRHVTADRDGIGTGLAGGLGQPVFATREQRDTGARLPEMRRDAPPQPARRSDDHHSHRCRLPARIHCQAPTPIGLISS